jgi:hypothetical protein
MRFALPGLALGLMLLLGGAVAAQESPPAADKAPSQPKVLTGKERLGEKWMDEQRLDNCKVPPDKRGAKPRPDKCADTPTG